MAMRRQPTSGNPRVSSAIASIRRQEKVVRQEKAMGTIHILGISQGHIIPEIRAGGKTWFPKRNPRMQACIRG
jgi:acyl CoA:acetate/3-ketoacid CoA transferase alpha subunit